MSEFYSQDLDKIDHIDKNLLSDLDKWLEQIEKDLNSRYNTLEFHCMDLILKEILTNGLQDMICDNTIYKD